MSNQPNKTNGAKPAVRKKKNLLDDRRVRLALSVLGAIVAWMVTAFLRQKEEALAKQEKDYEAQQAEIKRLTDWIEKWTSAVASS